MAGLFPRWSNSVIKLGVFGLFLGCTALVVGPMLYVRSPFNTDQGASVRQPVEFDHRHHVGDDGIPCVYCHNGAETAASAGYPSTDVCMGCHQQIWIHSPLLQAVRDSWFQRRPIPWRRVHDLPDHVQFNHSIHVQRGLGCVACHGRVDQAARIRKVNTLQMNWCIRCHRDTRGRLAAAVARPGLGPIWGGPAQTIDDRGLPPSSRDVTALLTCSACHR